VHPEFDGFFNQFFGFGMGPDMFGDGDYEPKPADTVKPYDVTLEDLYKGKHVKMMSKRQVICPSCKGYFIPLRFLKVELRFL
jgi:DnaJ homolog subfamily A member 2